MGRTLLTGGTGLIGAHVARALLERGDDLRLGLRAGAKLDDPVLTDAERVRCDILDRGSVRRALRGVDRVFHTAALTSLRAPRERTFEVNVTGTRLVLEEAERAEVERVVFTSSTAAIGPAPEGGTASEASVYTHGHGIPYVESRHAAELQAYRAAARGLPVVILNPTHVFGRGDVHRSSTDIVRRFLQRGIPAYTDGATNIVDAADVARGHLLADERGVPAERYILGNRNFTLDRLFADLARISGVAPPALKLPRAAALAFAEAAERLPGRPPITVTEVRASSLWWTYRNTKAKAELGWKPSPHEDTLEATVAWYLEREGDRLASAGTGQPLGWRLAGLGVRRAQALGRRVTG